MTVAVLVSSNGAIFRYALRILRECGSAVDFIMISDRECNAEKIAGDFSLPLIRICPKNNQDFSAKCKEYLDGIGEISAVMTFVWRLVTKELINAYPCVNIHPALLPAFRGFHAIEQAFDARVKFFGSTLHMADEEMDHGEIIAQIQAPTIMGSSLAEMTETVFIQDIYLFLLFIDLLEREQLKVYPKAKCKLFGSTQFTDRCNPSIENEKYLRAIQKLQIEKGLKVI